MGIRSDLRARAGIAVLSLTAAACASAPPAPGAVPADLAGVWVLNDLQSSDDSRLRVEPYPQRIPGSTPVDSLPDLLGGYRAAEIVRALAAVRVPADTIIVEQQPGALALRRPGDRTLSLAPGSGTGEQVWLNDLPSNVRSKWQGHRLVVEHRIAQTVQVTEYYARTIGMQQLIVFTTVRGTGMHEYSVRRVYDLVAAPTARPGAGTARPGAGTARPGTGTARPGAGTARPGAVTARPGAGTAPVARAAAAAPSPSAPRRS